MSVDEDAGPKRVLDQHDSHKFGLGFPKRSYVHFETVFLDYKLMIIS